MAAVNKAPTAQYLKATDAREKLKALLAKHKIEYVRAYSSWDTRQEKVRMKLWAINGVVNPKLRTKIQKLGFDLLRGPQWSPTTSLVGYF
ncbi:hypothetical protein D3C75_437340 [compost metagenome]